MLQRSIYCHNSSMCLSVRQSLCHALALWL